MPNDRLAIVADKLGVTVEYLTTGENSDGYYYDKETLEIAQEVYQNKDLHVLFDLARGSSPDEIKDFTNMLLIMKKRERHED